MKASVGVKVYTVQANCVDVLHSVLGVGTGVRATSAYGALGGVTLSIGSSRVPLPHRPGHRQSGP